LIALRRWTGSLLTNAGTATWLMLWPEDGRMMKEDVRGVFDGSIFYTIAARRAKGMRPGKSGKWVD
jgi:hypothetical protein